MDRIEITTSAVPAPGGRTAAFDALFTRAYPAAVGLAQLVLDRDRSVPVASAQMATEVALEALVRARVRRLVDDERSVARVMGWVADGCVSRLVGHPGEVPLDLWLTSTDPSFAAVAGTDEDGVPLPGWLSLSELQEVLAASGRTDRRVGVVVLGAGLGPAEAGALLDRDEADVRRRVRRIGLRLVAARRVSGREPFPEPGAAA